MEAALGRAPCGARRIEMQKERREGNITSEASLNKLRGVYAQAAEALVGQKTSNGIEIKSVAVHFASRVIGNPEEGQGRNDCKLC